MNEYILVVTIALLLVYLGIKEIISWLEREDLYSRIQARDLNEYTSNKVAEINEKKTPPKKEEQYIKL